MSETARLALLGIFATILVGVITAWATIFAGSNKDKTPRWLALLGVFALVGMLLIGYQVVLPSPPGETTGAQSGAGVADLASATLAPDFILTLTKATAAPTQQQARTTSRPTSVVAPLPSGNIADDIPGSPLPFAKSFSSVLDKDTKLAHMFSFPLAAGQKVNIAAKANAPLFLYYHKPGAISFSASKVLLCEFNVSCSASLIAATEGLYYLQIATNGSGVAYSLTVTPDGEVPAPAVEADIPGTPLTLGTPFAAVLDFTTRPSDVHSFNLTAGKKSTLLLKQTARYSCTTTIQVLRRLRLAVQLFVNTEMIAQMR